MLIADKVSDFCDNAQIKTYAFFKFINNPIEPYHVLTIFLNFAVRINKKHYNQAMKTKRFLHYIYIGATASLLAFTSCNRHRADSTPADGDTIRMAYSELLTIVKHDGYKVAEIRNPWKQGKVLHRYVLVERADSARMASKTAGMKEATIVYTPIRRSVMFTSPHCWLLGQLGAEDVVKGVCDLSYIYVPYVQDGIKKGGITDCGNSMSPTVERIVAQLRTTSANILSAASSLPTSMP